MTIKNLLLHMAPLQYVEIYIRQKKEYEGKASAGILQLPDCILNLTVKKIGSADYLKKPQIEGLTDYSIISLVVDY